MLQSMGSQRIRYEWVTEQQQHVKQYMGLPWWLRWYRICLECRRPEFSPWLGKIPWRREWLPTPVFLPEKSHEQRSLMGYSTWDHKEADMTELLILSLSKQYTLLKPC